MTDIIDLSLLKETRALLETLLQKRGLTYFLDKEGARPLFSIEKAKVELVVKTARTKLEKRGRPVHPKAVERCRTEVRRELIRRVTEAMMRVGY